MRLTVLGCGSSQGVPRIGGAWGACNPSNARNRRSRPSVLVDWDGVNVLVDTSPDLRQQLLDSATARIDAVLFTHAHADHTHGIDDLRGIHRLNGRPIEVHAEAPVLEEIAARFAYLFVGAAESATGAGPAYTPFLLPRPITGDFEIRGRPVGVFPQDHGSTGSTGFRFDRLAYSTDVVALPEASLSKLSGVETWVVDCLRLAPAHPSHAHWPVVRAWLDRVAPERAVLTHMNDETDYDVLRDATPDAVEPAYDGMVLDVP